VLRGECRNDAHCEKFKDELQRCTDRVNSRKETKETCSQELMDFMECVDHCVSPAAIFTSSWSPDSAGGFYK